MTGDEGGRNRTPPSMRDLARPSLVVGVVVAVLGTLLLFVPGVAAAIPGNDTIVLAIGLGALLAGVSQVMERRRTELNLAETGDPEVPLAPSTPGESIQEDLDHVERLWRPRQAVRRRLRKRLYETAVAAVRRRERVSRETARKLVDRGEWTDDPHTARFLGNPEVVQRPRTRENLPEFLSMRSRYAFRTRRAVRSVLELAEDGDDDRSDGDSPRTLSRGPATDDRRRPYDRDTRRWVGVGGTGLLVGGIGIAASKPGLLLLAVVGVAYAAFAFRARPPTVDLRIERTLENLDGDGTDDGAKADGGTRVEDGPKADDGPKIDDETRADDGAGVDESKAGDEVDESTGGPAIDASPGDRVRVTLTVENAGDQVLSDLRVVDGVPPGLEVLDGSPRLGTALRPGHTANLTYDVEAARGDHEFGPLQVLARDASGAVEREVQRPAPGRLTCLPDLQGVGTVPLFGTATRYTGRVSTESGGEGVEFHSTREYRPGDPPGRIDWNRHARTRELATLLFREENAATVVLLLDTREQAFQVGSPGERHAVERGVEAAGRLFESLLDGGDRVGLAAFGPESCWVDPGAGSTHREHVRRTLATHPAFRYDTPEGRFLPSTQLATIRRRAPVDAQFVLLSPLTDDYIETVARRLKAHGHPVTVVSPDPTATRTLGQRLARVERDARLNRLRESAVRVVDWAPDEDLHVALDRASAGWSA